MLGRATNLKFRSGPHVCTIKKLVVEVFNDSLFLIRYSIRVYILVKAHKDGDVKTVRNAASEVLFLN